MTRRGGEEIAIGRARRGFALVTVIWGLAVIALLIVSFMSSARLQLQTAYNLAGATKADLLADAALNAAFMTLMSERESAGPNLAQQPPHDGAPRFCALEGAAVAIAVEGESGKVDLNAAERNILQATLAGLGLDRRQAETIATSIMAFRSRSPPQDLLSAGEGSDARPFPPKRDMFQSVLELDQVSGVTPELFSGLAPLVTVHSGSQGLDRRAAPPALFAALAGRPPEEVAALGQRPYPNALDRNDPRFPQNFNQVGVRGAVLAHVEVLLPAGQSSVREAIFDLNDGRGPGSALKEARKGAARYLDELRQAMQSGGGPDC